MNIPFVILLAFNSQFFRITVAVLRLYTTTYKVIF